MRKVAVLVAALGAVVGALLAPGSGGATPVSGAADMSAAGADGVGVADAPTAQELLAKLTSCAQISNGTYRTDEEAGRTIPVCDKNGAVWWQADMDIDCDGVRTTQCNEDTDCCFLPDTAFHTSDDQPLNAAELPFVVVPSPSSTWDYRQFGIQGGGAVAIIYNGQVEYAVVGDTGPIAIIGEASYRAAAVLGIDPDPSTGGTDSGVTYIFFKDSRVSPIESHDEAVSTGQDPIPLSLKSIRRSEAWEGFFVRLSRSLTCRWWRGRVSGFSVSGCRMLSRCR